MGWSNMSEAKTGNPTESIVGANVTTRSIPWSIGLALFLLVGIIAVMGLRQHREFFHDDAYITLRYADQWQNGQGPVWNESERVEGYTSFLHLATLYSLQSLELTPETLARIVGVLSYLSIGIFIVGFSFRFHTTYLRIPLALVLLASIMTSFPLIAWSWGGLETSLYTFLLMVCIYLFTIWCSRQSNSKHLTLGILFGLTVMTRPEAVLFVAVSILALWAIHRSFKPSLVLVLGFCLIYLPYFVWRWNYYGEPLPNTYYAKLGTPLYKRLQDGFYYLHTFVRTAPWLPLVAIGCWLYTLFKQPDRRTAAWYSLSAHCLIGVIYIVWTGGDHMPAYRFWTPLLPVFTLLITYTLFPIDPEGNSDDSKSLSLTPAMVMVSLLLALSFLQFLSADERMLNARRADPAGATGKKIGTYISTHFPDDSLIATNSAGAVAFFAPQKQFIDMLGLNDRQIAKRENVPMLTYWQQFPGHSKGDGRYVISREPDYIILGPAQGTVGKIENKNRQNLVWFLSDQEIVEQTDFLQRYELKQVQIHDTLTFTYYQRKQSH